MGTLTNRMTNQETVDQKEGRRKMIFLFLAMLGIYTANFRIMEILDPVTTTYLPVSILSEGNFELSEFKSLIREKVLVEVNGNFYSIYPVFSSVLVTPIYFVPFILGAFDPIYEFPQSDDIAKKVWFIPYLGKFAASILAALSVLIFFSIMKIKFPDRNAMKYAICFGLGTSVWSISSQALFQHPANQVFLLLSVYFLVIKKNLRLYTSLAGLSLALAVLARPFSVLFLLVITIYVLIDRRKYFTYLLGGIILPTFFLLMYNFTHFGSIFETGYGDEAYQWTGNVFEGLVGSLISPGRGLFIFTPFLIFGFIGMFKFIKNNVKDGLMIAVGIGIIVHLLAITKWHGWHGGGSWSYRLILDVIPFIMLFIPYYEFSFSKTKKRIFKILVIYSIFIQFLGASTFVSRRMDVWDWRLSSIVWCLNETRPKLFTIVYDSGLVKRSDDGSVINRFVHSVNYSLQGFYRLISPFPRYDWDENKGDETD